MRAIDPKQKSTHQGMIVLHDDLAITVSYTIRASNNEQIIYSNLRRVSMSIFKPGGE